MAFAEKNDITALWAENSRIRTVKETESTNNDMRLLADQGLPEGFWLKADTQTKGRGRQGRQWQLPEGNLAISTLVRLKKTDSNLSGLAFVAALALYQAASLFVKPELLSLKWPNDLMLKGAKCAGILLEGHEDAMIFGFGVNLKQAAKLDRPTAALADFTDKAPEKTAFSEALAASFSDWLDIWRKQGIEIIHDNWLKKAHNIHTPLTIHKENGELVCGYFAGLDSSGALKLRLHTNQICLFHSGDVLLARS
ncbi:MAG: biotin--[acetyl-CoA-carboxylase] ligase [Zymomonas mobilis]|uniref:BirA family biotin operon repressor/biotin-[acetyl-CoA-carboxylase] ligase n=1 Tax=Zymomonas mobilis TaxID=542 RepID=A0A542VYS7_ZYMMB|nr:biotin--[acetyl-CoA-carboxylase] ligase [Zymomonas mobilis]TQL16482.1 BirA family biotin operon repressor/biotin-[acetyl-CoA-carboxylase] ligase [Zymomonas mobilis]